MFWIALSPSREDQRTAWSWWALRFSPRVAWAEGALLVEASGSLRLFGGRQPLLRLLLNAHPDLGPATWACGPNSLVALALLRCKQQGLPKPTRLPDALPLAWLAAAAPHLGLLERTGIVTWGQLRALPRAGVARRFGAALLEALDIAWGARPETHDWVVAPEAFDLGAELAQVASSAADLQLPAGQLFDRLQLWLQARNRGVLALELEWTLDLKRLNGMQLPPRQQLLLRTAQATQDTAHLRKLLAEQLARFTLAAPANHLRLRSVETVPWGGATTSLLPNEQRAGERLHQLVERLSARLGEANVVVPVARADHRPECKQQWAPARSATPAAPPEADALYPSWVLPQPLRLRLQGETPCFGGPLRRLARLYRVETAWWEPEGACLRDYFVARSPQAGLVWIYRERPQHLADGLAHGGSFRWYLQGLYA